MNTATARRVLTPEHEAPSVSGNAAAYALGESDGRQGWGHDIAAVPNRFASAYNDGYTRGIRQYLDARAPR